MSEHPAPRRVVVITGASDGIGRAAALALHARGDKVILAGRSAEKTRATAADLDGAEFHVADFARLADVRRLAGALVAAHPRIDVLLNNAGLIAGPQRVETEDGHELTFQVNHLAPFLLTLLLREPLVAGGARVLQTSSSAGDRARIAIDDLDSRRTYSAFAAYRASKLENVLFTRELSRRWGQHGITSASFRPGVVRTQWGHGGPFAIRAVTTSPLRYLLRSPERGADTLVWLATSRPGGDWETGNYYADRKPARPNPLANDEVLGRALWDRSEAMLGRTAAGTQP